MMRKRDANSVFSKTKLRAESSSSSTIFSFLLFLPCIQNGGSSEREGKIIRVGAGGGREGARKKAKVVVITSVGVAKSSEARD